MIVFLIGNKSLHKLELPSKIEGSFFMTDPQIDENLFNIDAVDNNWVLKSNSNIKIFDVNNNIIYSKNIKSSDLCLIDINNIKKVIYFLNTYNNTNSIYKLTGNFSLSIGKQNDCDILFDSYYIQNKHIILEYNDSKWILKSQPNSFVYLNNRLVNNNNQVLNYGDILFTFGLNIIVMKDSIIINNPLNRVIINSSKLSKVEYNDTEVEYKEVKEEELYKDDDYYFNTPRLRRFIETYDLKMANPPDKQNSEDMPLLLVLGPMVTMAMLSLMMAMDTIIKIIKGETTFAQSWLSLMMPATMLLTSLLWPSLTRRWQKKQQNKKELTRQEKYGKYIEEKRKEIIDETINQTAILKENLITLKECYNIIINKKRVLWERRISQKDFLCIRVGIGDRPIDMNIDFSDDDFSIEHDNLKDRANNMINESKMLHNVPISYSFFNKRATAIMGNYEITKDFVDNMLLQFIAFHSYQDLKIVIFTDEENKTNWEVYKNLPHLFSNNKEIRFFASTDDERKNLSMYLEQELVNRATDGKNSDIVEKEEDKKSSTDSEDSPTQTFSPYYLIITDDYMKIRKLGICETVFSIDQDMGFTFVILENKLAHLPGKCVDFITLDNQFCGILHNGADNYTQQSFSNEIDNTIDMKKCVDVLSNIPIEFDEDLKYLPTSLTFLEMYNVGKLEQLNIMNRWKLNDPTSSLRAPIGINDQSNIIYLDLHEKYHGPHGLIAGTTGSGKSEFIITYVLSMCVNYSPNEVAFILIDYKGGGLAGAFENKKNNVRLPHLAGTITNLDKNEMNRTLVSIQSELKRRQSKFNEARDELGESTIDIYKYQKFFREGKLKEPMPHLFIICDEFAELKAQQPDFMDNLISAARIGRSLGVHLILATQKPSGVVNDQIWSNTKFRVCLKVAEKEDSNEVIKCPDAAEIKNAGRFYLQVGYNEIFVLGQSGWCGAPYMPSDVVKKENDRSISFIDDIGNVIKNISDDANKKRLILEGDQLSNILKYITLLSEKESLKAKNLWLENIPVNLTLNNVITKYRFNDSKPTAIIGEYDDPSNQYQNILTLPLDEDANTMIYGLSGSSREMFLRTIIYSVSEIYSSEDVNFYIFDFGSESFEIFTKLPHVGDVVFSNETDKVDKLLKLIDDEIERRKKLFADYNGEYSNYCKNSGKKLPLFVVIFNSLESFNELYPNDEDLLVKLTREGKRYGVIFIVATSTKSGLFSRFLKNFSHQYVLDMNSKDDYEDILGRIGNVYPKDVPGRGLYKGELVYEFQVAKFCEDNEIVEFIKEKANEISKSNTFYAKPVPVLPEVVSIDLLKENLTSLKSVPVGMGKENLKSYNYNFKSDKVTLISSNELENCKSFLKNLMTSFNILKNVISVLFDFEDVFNDLKQNCSAYCNQNFDNFLDKMINYVDEKILGTEYNIVFIITGIEKFYSIIDSIKIDEIFKKIKSIENCNIILVDSSFKLKKVAFESWFTDTTNSSNGIWIGNGVQEQEVIKTNDYNKKYSEKISNNYAWIVKNGSGTLVKLISDKGVENEE